MHNNYFDIVMEYIEENVTKPTEGIKRGIPSLIVRHSRAFGGHFNILTDCKEGRHCISGRPGSIGPKCEGDRAGMALLCGRSRVRHGCSEYAPPGYPW